MYMFTCYMYMFVVHVVHKVIVYWHSLCMFLINLDREAPAALQLQPPRNRFSKFQQRVCFTSLHLCATEGWRGVGATQSRVTPLSSTK